MSPTTTKAPTNHLPRMHERYQKVIVPALAKEFHKRHPMAAARLQKIVVNIGCGEAAHDAKILEAAQRDLGLITGQKPLVTRAKKAISNFKIKEGDAVGCKVTLRRRRMYEFLDRLVSIALPRIRDFRGLNPKGFDEGGNYNFGLKEHTIFPEIQEHVATAIGMDIVLVTNASSKDEAMALLKGFGFPFATKEQQRA
ncbi:MAG: 50S ribosomal protein L5 [Candidatus Omnitrophica bacterium CG11_big_fil_rev_8_21_14_0_20_63_9]|nr:MAG: 50S ribosomal protein L5 [Candidatus Omnitrophica bacterium CG11_big_fil_rev_8_21_14_0_20_63_9]